MKKYTATIDKKIKKEYPGAISYPVFEENDSPIAGCCAMLNFFHSPEYPAEFGVHQDNEGFYVVAGHGKMTIGEKEYLLEPGTGMFAPKGVPHAIKCAEGETLEIFIYHFPA